MERSPRRLLQVGRTEGALFFTSVPLIVELTEILSRSKFEQKISASLLPIDKLVDLYLELAIGVLPLATPRLASDPDDDVVIGTALAAKADLLVTGDRGQMSVAAFEGGRIVSVHEALRSCEAS